jgi:hypothetical protein
MLKYLITTILLLAFSAGTNAQSFVNAKYGGDFLSVGAGARALGMGSAYSAIASDVTSAYWNPAGLAEISSFDIAYMHSERFSGIVSYDYGAVAYPLSDNRGTLAISVFRQGVDNIKNTLNAWDKERNQPRENAEDYFEEFSVSDLAFYLSYGTEIGNGLSAGGSVKVVHHRLGPFANAWGYSLDLGTRYRLGDYHFALMVTDITTMMKFWTVNRSAFGDFEETFDDEVPTGQNEKVLPAIKAGAGRVFPVGDFRLTAAADLDIRFENRRAYYFNAGRVSFEPHIGFEGRYKERVSLRFGLTDFNTDPDHKIYMSPTLGSGLHFTNIHIDYGFSNFSGVSEVLGVTHRISLRIVL